MTYRIFKMLLELKLIDDEHIAVEPYDCIGEQVCIDYEYKWWDKDKYVGILKKWTEE